MRLLFWASHVSNVCSEGFKAREDVEVARTAEVLLKVALELEHVAQILGARETKAAVDLGRHVVVAHLLTQRLGERGGHLRAGQMLAGDADGLADELAAVLEDAVGALADVLGGDARQASCRPWAA